MATQNGCCESSHGSGEIQFENSAYRFWHSDCAIIPYMADDKRLTPKETKETVERARKLREKAKQTRSKAETARKRAHDVNQAAFRVMRESTES